MSPVPAPSSHGAAYLPLDEFVVAVARGLGPVYDPALRSWIYDTRHGPPRGRLPLTFHARVVPPPGELRALIGAPPARGLDALLCFADGQRVDAPGVPTQPTCARAALVFVETSAEPVLPADLIRGTRSGDGVAVGTHDEEEALFWRLVTTDSCEVVALGVLLALRKLRDLGVSVISEGGEPIEAFGMHTARRVSPYVRHVKLSRSGHRVVVADDGSAARVVPVSSAADDGGGRGGARGGGSVHCDDGSLHQLVWLRDRGGASVLADWTGPQFGIDDTILPTRTPHWRASASPREELEATRGLRLIGSALRFDGAELPSEYGIGGGDDASSRMHVYVGEWIAESVVRRLAWEGRVNHNRLRANA